MSSTLERGDDFEVQRLAATRAAIDPDRRQTRSDIVASIAVELLATSGDRGIEELAQALNQFWRTEAITAPELEAVLEQAKAAGLVAVLQDFTGRGKWQATPSARQEAEQDRKWAHEVVAKFEAEIADRLDDLGLSLDRKAAGRASSALLRALASGCASTYEKPVLGPEFLRPVEFDRQRVLREVEKVNPKPLRSALRALVDAAIDPDDDFANDLVHMLVVGSILQAFVSKRDLGTQVDLSGTRILLDTTTLIDLVDDESPNRRVIENVIKLSVQLGAYVAVADHSIEEWNRVWDAADKESPEHLDAEFIPRNLGRIAVRVNPFVAQFLNEKAFHPSLTWQAFKASRIRITPRLQAMGVVVRPHGNERDADRELVGVMTAKLKEMSSDQNVMGKRTPSAAEADSLSAAMVARWRKDNPSVPCSAFFISNERLTAIAYGAAQDVDEVPLTVKPGAWAMYAACLTGDDPTKRAELAEIVGSAVVRQSFFGLATSYTLEEVMQIADLLAEPGHELSVEDSRDVVQLDLLNLLEDAEDATSEARVAAAGAEVMRRRSARRDARARRAQDEAVRQVDTVKAEKRESEVALDAQLAEERAAGNRRVKEVQDQKDLEVAALAVKVKKSRRLMAVIVGVVLLASLVTGLLLTGTISTKWAIVSYFLVVIVLCDGVRFSSKPEVKWWEPVLIGASAAAWAGIGVLAAMPASPPH